MEDLNYSKLIKTKDAVLRLMDNPDFKEVILNGYMDGVVKGLVTSLAYTSKAESKTMALEKLSAISHLQSFLDGLVAQGRRAEETLNEPQDEPEGVY